MVVLINFGPNALKVEYTNGNRSFIKQLPTNAFVAMKGLNVSEQISNRVALANHGVTIYDFERNTYYYNNPATPTGATLGFIFVDDNKKPSELATFGATGLTAGYNRLKSMM